MEISQLKSAAGALRSAKELGHKSYLRQLREILWCKRHVLHFGISDYFDQRLFESDRDYDSMSSVAGWRMESWLDDQLNPLNWRGLSEDKLATYAILDSACIPYPRILSLFHAQGRQYKGANTFTDAAQMADHLRSDAVYPCFVKPIFGVVGAGAASLLGYDPADDRITLGNGERICPAEFCRKLEQPHPSVVVRAGYLFQELVEQHQDLKLRCGMALSTIRAIVVIEDEGPVLHRTDWRIAVGRNMTDNFDKGRSGNLLAPVDPASGRVMRVVHGSGLSQKLVECHPDTTMPLPGLVLPDWDQLRQTCLAAARAFPMLRFQHWDVAISARGPLILELNATGGIGASQCMTGRGIYDGPLRHLVEGTGLAAGWTPRP